MQVNFSSPKEKNYNHSNAKKEVSVNINCTIEYLEIGKAQNKLNSLSISDSSPECFPSTSKHGEETSAGKIIKEKFAGIAKEKLEPSLTRKAHPSLKTNYDKTEPFVESNYTNVMHLSESYAKKAQPKIEYKSKPYNEKHYHVKETQASVKHYHGPTAFYHDEMRYRGNSPEISSSAASISKMKGAIPKTDTIFRNSTVNYNFKIEQDEKDSQLFRQQIQGGVRRYENHWDNFDRQYRSWISQRENTIQKLQELVENVHKDQRMFNQGNVFLKEINVGSRELKNCNSSTSVDFFASLAAFVTDAASGITSAVQACNVDIHATTFKEIVENDAKVTKPLYAARSRCLEEYRNVEEIIRQCHLETFGSTIDTISNALNVDDLLSDIKNAKGENAVGQVIDSVGDFLKRNANMEVMGEVCNSIQDYMDSNPAALQACKSAGKALYGVYDTWGRDHRQGRLSIEGNMSIISNKIMLIEERRELSKLRSVADNDEENQAKLESEIQDAISSLQSEMREMNNIFERRNQTHNERPWYF